MSHDFSNKFTKITVGKCSPRNLQRIQERDVTFHKVSQGPEELTAIDLVRHSADNRCADCQPVDDGSARLATDKHIAAEYNAEGPDRICIPVCLKGPTQYHQSPCGHRQYALLAGKEGHKLGQDTDQYKNYDQHRHGT